MIEPLWLDSQVVCAIQSEILTESGGASGILNEGALESTLNKPQNWYQYGENVTLYDLAATYGYGLAKNHCFVDGNKRVALIAVYTFLWINGIELIASEVDAASCFLNLAATVEAQEVAIKQLATWIQKNSTVISQED